MSFAVFEMLFQEQTRGLMPVDRKDGRYYIRSPMWYKDGDGPLVEMVEDGDGYHFTDRGDSLSRLCTGLPEGAEPPTGHPQLQSALLVHEVELRDDGTLVRHCGKSRYGVGEAFFDFLHCLLKIDEITVGEGRSTS